MSLDFEYTIKRSAKRKRLTITVERDCAVVVHAPVDVSDEKISQIVEAKQRWIREKLNHPQKYVKPLHPPGKELVNGESALYLGRHYRIELVDCRDQQVRFEQKFIIPEWLGAGRRTVLREWYQQRAAEKILPRVELLAKKMGVVYANARLVDNLYRWGSCTPNDNVHFNWRLIKAPAYVIDYMIVHELAHLREPNHTPRFWNIVRAQSPKMEKAKQWLKDHGQLLEEEV
ncbi:MAG: putative metal-dependent hydrolase [Lentimonas sp.]|jgi:predicted metal-dependent hydrolase